MGESKTARFVTTEECDENIARIRSDMLADQAEVEVWEGLKYMIDAGYIVIFDEVTEKYKTVKPGEPYKFVT